MSKDRETLIRVARIAEGSPPVLVYAGDPPKPIRPRWVVVSICQDASGIPPSYGVYFLGESGSLLEVCFFESARIALDQAQAMAGATPLHWCAGTFEVPEDGELDPAEFSRYFAE